MSKHNDFFRDQKKFKTNFIFAFDSSITLVTQMATLFQMVCCQFLATATGLQSYAFHF